MLLSAEVKDPLLKSIQDTLSKQLNSMIHFREQVYQHKKEVKQEELILQSRLRKAEKDAAKADRQRVLSTAVEMNFERRCAHDDRVGKMKYYLCIVYTHLSYHCASFVIYFFLPFQVYLIQF